MSIEQALLQEVEESQKWLKLEEDEVLTKGISSMISITVVHDILVKSCEPFC